MCVWCVCVVCVCGVCEGRGYDVEEGCVQMNRSLYVRRGLHTGYRGKWKRVCACMCVRVRAFTCACVCVKRVTCVRGE